MIKPKHPKDPALVQTSSIAWKVALLFVAWGVAWVIATDLIVYQVVANKAAIARLESAKGWLFVALAMGVLYVVTASSVRKLARSNATMGAVFKSISDGVLLLGRDGKIVLANPAATRLLGAEEPEELLGIGAEEFARRFHVGLTNGHLVEPTQYVSQRALKGENPAPYKAVIHPPGQPEVIAICTGAPVRPVAEGPIVLAVSVMHDITAVEHLQQMRDEFVSSAAHTLKTPVAIINAQAELLASGKTPSWKGSTDAIGRQCGRISRMIENLLVLARIRSESLHLDPEALDLAEVVDEVAREMQHASTEHGLATKLRAHPTVFADRDRLALVVRNVIELAYRRAAPNSTIEIELDQIDGRGRLSASYPLRAPAEQHPSQHFGLEGSSLERYVTDELVDATSGTLGSDSVGHYRRQDWVELPTSEGPPHV